MTIDPGFLDELDRFDAAMNRETTALRSGEQESPSVGEGLTFSDYRRYSPGDDVRLIDWKLFARTEEYYIKQFEEERNLTVHVLLDASGSMDFGAGVDTDPADGRAPSDDTHKFEYAAKLGLGFAYLTARENNDFRFSTFADVHDRLDGGRSNRGELFGLVDRLNDTTPAGAGDIATALEEYADTIRSRSLVVVLGDFLADPDAVEAGLSALARNDLLAIQVLAPGELEPGVAGDTVFEDPETDATLRTYFGGRLARQYRDRLDRHAGAIEDCCTGLRADYRLVNTAEDFFDAFGRVWVG